VAILQDLLGYAPSPIAFDASMNAETKRRWPGNLQVVGKHPSGALLRSKGVGVITLLGLRAALLAGGCRGGVGGGGAAFHTIT
jgi:hypothetical protein